jgi:hypothetical protein
VLNLFPLSSAWVSISFAGIKVSGGSSSRILLSRRWQFNIYILFVSQILGNARAIKRWPCRTLWDRTMEAIDASVLFPHFLPDSSRTRRPRRGLDRWRGRTRRPTGEIVRNGEVLHSDEAVLSHGVGADFALTPATPYSPAAGRVPSPVLCSWTLWLAASPSHVLWSLAAVTSRYHELRTKTPRRWAD